MRAVCWMDAGDVRVTDGAGHELPLDDAREAYRMSRDKSGECVKVVLKP